ncbi:MAG: glutaredoxin domain-containing protein [Eubacteriaceae bacterium]
MKREIKLYTWPHCPYCNHAKELLRELGLSFSDTNVFNNEEMRKKLEDQTGQRTVPFVFVGDVFVGGYTELKALNESGEFQKLLNN